jgi:hypothetical protein
VADSFYEAADGGYLATEATRGPWSVDHQHGGPPAALLAREIERLAGDEWQVVRLTLEILRPIPIGPVVVSARIARPGRRVQMAEAELSAGGEVVIMGRGWLIRRGSVDFEDPSGQGDITPPGPQEGVEKPFFPTGRDRGYHTSVEQRFLEGAFLEPGPARAWIRMRIPLVAGEEPSQLARVLVAADSANGVSAPLDYEAYLFINTDLTVSLQRMPEGEWILLDAVTRPQHSGIGISDTALHDRRGLIGRSVQTLLVAPR